MTADSKEPRVTHPYVKSTRRTRVRKSAGSGIARRTREHTAHPAADPRRIHPHRTQPHPSGARRAHHRPSRPAGPRVTGHDLLSVTQAAERLGTPERFIRRLIAQRRVRFYKVGRYIRFDVVDLDAFIDNGRVEPWL
ncbi:MAG TPA: helix-turn-helix domain-containing protein [Sporichthyaceae bacterium]